MLNYAFDDYLDLSNNEHYQLAAILDNITEQEYEGELGEYFSIGVEE